MKSIVEAIFKYALEKPNVLCVVDEKDAFSYEVFSGKIISLVEFLRNNGVKKGDKVIVECTQDARYIAIDMALELIGGVFVPVEMNVSEERFESIREETESKISFSRLDIPELKDVLTSTFDYSNLIFPNETDIAEILYTTGTTGKSKGIVLSNANNVAVADNIIDGTRMKSGNVELVPLPISHSHGLRTCYANFLNGSTVVIVNGIMRVKKWVNLIAEYGVTALDLSPTAARALIKVTHGDMKVYEKVIDYVEIGTAALDEDLKTDLCGLLPFSRLYNFYGSTESGRVCTYDFNEEKGLVNCIGYPTKNATFIITDENRVPIESDADNMGLLAIKGGMNMLEYFNSKVLTEETLRDGYILTNDIGYIDKTGKVYMIGRQGSVINYMGIKIAPEEIEAVANRYEEIFDCACVPAKDVNGFEVPKLFVVLADSGKKFDKQVFREFLKGELEANKLPQIVETIEEIPRASNGKILRNKLL